MMDTERTVRLAEERDRLAEQYERLEDADDEHDAISWSLNELDQQGAALQALIDEHGSEASVTISGLTAGEYGLVEDRVEHARQQRDRATMRGYHRVVYAAAGLVEAPFFDPGDVSDPPWEARTQEERLDEKIATVADQNIGLVKWLYTLVDDETTPDEGNWRQRSGPPAEDA